MGHENNNILKLFFPVVGITFLCACYFFTNQYL